jgi:hypothetical protein
MKNTPQGFLLMECIVLISLSFLLVTLFIQSVVIKIALINQAAQKRGIALNHQCYQIFCKRYQLLRHDSLVPTRLYGQKKIQGVHRKSPGIIIKKTEKNNFYHLIKVDVFQGDKVIC